MKRCSFFWELVIETTGETDGVDALEETLKWGEPSLFQNGSTTSHGLERKISGAICKCTFSVAASWLIPFVWYLVTSSDTKGKGHHFPTK